MSRPKTCGRCSENLNAEERANPERDADNNVICDECYDRNFRDYCSRCEEKVEKSEVESKPGEIIGIWRTAPGLCVEMEPGYYRVLGWPFFADGMIEGYFCQDRLRLICGLDELGQQSAKDSRCMSGPLCEDCREKLERRLEAEAA